MLLLIITITIITIIIVIIRMNIIIILLMIIIIFPASGSVHQNRGYSVLLRSTTTPTQLSIVLLLLLLLLPTLLLGNGLLGGPWAKCMFSKSNVQTRRSKSCNLRCILNTWSATRHKYLVDYTALAEQRTLGIEPGTSCIRGPILTN